MRPICSRMSLAALLAALLALSFSAIAPQTEAAQDATAGQQFKIGDYTAVSLDDGILEFPNDGKSFVVGHSPSEVAKVLAEANLPTDHVTLDNHPLLVRAGDRVLLFDTGAGRYFGPGAGKLPQSLAASGVDPSSVTDIFISHAHGDHIGGLVTSAGTLAFPNASIHMSVPEWQWLSGMKGADGKIIGVPDVGAIVAIIRPKVAAFQPGDTLLPGMVKAVEIDGHTPGHSGYEIGSGADTIFYVGDAMHSYVISVREPMWRVAFDHDPDLGLISRVALVRRLAESGQRIFVVHFPFPGVGKIIQRNKGYEWVPEPTR